MKKWQKERLILMRDAVKELMVFIGDQKSGRMPRAYSLLDNMRNNIEIFVIIPEEQETDFTQLEHILFRDWRAANDEWDDMTEKESFESVHFRNFLELLDRVEEYFP